MMKSIVIIFISTQSLLIAKETTNIFFDCKISENTNFNLKNCKNSEIECGEWLEMKSIGLNSSNIIKSYSLIWGDGRFIPAELIFLKKGVLNDFESNPKNKEIIHFLHKKNLMFNSDYSAKLIFGEKLIDANLDEEINHIKMPSHIGSTKIEFNLNPPILRPFIGFQYDLPDEDYDVRILFFVSCVDLEKIGDDFTNPYREFAKNINKLELASGNYDIRKEEFRFVDELVRASREHLLQDLPKKRPQSRFQNLKNTIVHPENEPFWLWLLGIFVLLSAISGWMWKRFFKKSP